MRWTHVQDVLKRDLVDKVRAAFHDQAGRYAGLSAFERLETAGLRAEFDAAAHSRSRGEMVRLLGEVEFAEAA